MNNSLNMLDRNQTNNGQIDDVSTIAVIPGIIVVLWTILANMVVVMCFIINRKKVWPTFSTQVLCLCVTDMFVGLSTLPFVTLPLLNRTLSYGICSVFFFLFYASQCASLYQIFGICVHRCVLINKASSINEQRSDIRVPFVLVICSWILSIVVNSLLLFFYGNSEVELKQCQFVEIFQGKARHAARFLFIVFFAPYILTNLLYIALCLRLKCIWKKVGPVQVNEIESELNRMPQSGLPPSSQQINRVGTTYTRASVRAQQNVITTIGVILAIFNICTIPLIAIFRMESLQMTRDVKFIVNTIFILNSAINPFVYAVRINWQRTALKLMLRRCFGTIFPCLR